MTRPFKGIALPTELTDLLNIKPSLLDCQVLCENKQEAPVQIVKGTSVIR